MALKQNIEAAAIVSLNAQKLALEQQKTLSEQ